MSHIVAVSGMHLSILFALVYALTLRQRVLSALLGIPVAFFLRQWQDLPLGNPGGGDAVSPLLARLCRREYDPPSALAFAVLVLLLGNPLTAASASFQLSVGQWRGILCFSSRLYAWMTRGAGKGQRLWTAGMPRSGVICGGEPGGLRCLRLPWPPGPSES